jgi:hypothetical protein
VVKATGFKVSQKSYSVISASFMLDEGEHLGQGLNSGGNATRS